MSSDNKNYQLAQESCRAAFFVQFISLQFSELLEEIDFSQFEADLFANLKGG
jgi:hypothetical protein